VTDLCLILIVFENEKSDDNLGHISFLAHAVRSYRAGLVVRLFGSPRDGAVAKRLADPFVKGSSDVATVKSINVSCDG